MVTFVMVHTAPPCKVFLWSWNINFSANSESAGINTGYEPSIRPVYTSIPSAFSFKSNFSLLILNFSVSFTLFCSLLIQNFYFHFILFYFILCSISSVFCEPLHLIFWPVLVDFLIRAVILKNLYSSCFSNNLLIMSDFSINSSCDYLLNGFRFCCWAHAWLTGHWFIPRDF